MVRKQQDEAQRAAELEADRAAAALAAEEARLKEQAAISSAPRSRLSIMPVANILAFRKAKEKIEMFRMSKQQTIAQTSSKAGGRVAHVATAPVVETKEKAPVISRPAPPILEATATKISYNIRMQYYNLMVKHCLDIYPVCEDAWHRAQTEELTVFKKCNSQIIYKNSAALAVNKLKKETIEAGNINTEKLVNNLSLLSLSNAQIPLIYILGVRRFHMKSY